MIKKEVLKTFFVPTNSYEQQSLQVYKLLVENFSNTFFVGGMVRNILLQKKVTDIDIATSATPTMLVKLLAKHNFTLDLSGQQFGVIKIMMDDRSLEIATFRTEHYSKSRYPKVKFVKDLRLDVKRRDFTINSLYFDHKMNYLLDLVDGLKDIKSKILRTVIEPSLMFEQDPLRIVRAYRFQKEYQLKFEAKTLQALNENFSLAKTLTPKRIITEIEKAKTQTVKTFLTKKFV